MKMPFRAKAQIISLLLFGLFMNPIAAQLSKENSKAIEELQTKFDAIVAKDKNDSLSSAVNKKLMFSVGGNLDFLESPNINGAYFDISGFFPRLFTLSEKEKVKLSEKERKGIMGKSRFGLEARLAQGRFAANTDSFDIDNSKFILSRRENDTIVVLAQDFRSRRETIQSYLSFSATSTYTPKGWENFPIYPAFHVEFTRRTSLRKINEIVTKQDTLTELFDPDGFYVRSPAKTETQTFKSISYNALFGPGVIFDLDDGKINYRIKTIVGRGFDIVPLGTSARQEQKWFYLAQFSVHHLGRGAFKVGGEVRSFFGETPIPSVYIAKTFSFETLSKLFN